MRDLTAPKPMLNATTPSQAEIVGTQFLDRVLTRLQRNRESRELAKETTYVECKSLLDCLLEYFQKIKR